MSSEHEAGIGSDPKLTAEARASARLDGETYCLPEESMAGWVSVKERLPLSNTERVLVAHREGVMVSRYLAGDWRDQFNGRLYAVTHWQPLPSPPEPTNGR